MSGGVITYNSWWDDCFPVSLLKSREKMDRERRGKTKKTKKKSRRKKMRLINKEI